jgi:2-methylisocitrate lyase-like PEP mutase family enzyme
MRAPSIADLLATDAPLVLPGVWDGLSALLAARAGFRALFLSGYSLSASLLGQPDFGLLTQTEVVDAARRVVGAAGVPVVVDVDTGYGNAFNVERTVAALVAMGAAGCFLEDQVWPKRCGHLRGKQVVPLDEYLPKLRAALRSRGRAAFHVTARTDARAAAGVGDALRRARAFADAGADAVFVEAPESADEMAAVRDALPAGVTLVANMVEGGRTPLRTAAALAAAGYRLIVVPVAGLLGAAHALRVVYGTLARDGITTAAQPQMVAFDEMNALLGADERYAREREWTG